MARLGDEEIQKGEKLRKIMEELKIDPGVHGNYTLVLESVLLVVVFVFYYFLI